MLKDVEAEGVQENVLTRSSLIVVKTIVPIQLDFLLFLLEGGLLVRVFKTVVFHLPRLRVQAVADHIGNSL